jgi:hypothetical protein
MARPFRIGTRQMGKEDRKMEAEPHPGNTGQRYWFVIPQPQC